MYQKLRALHLSTAMFSLIFLLAYAVSAVEYAHQNWAPHPHWTTQETRKLPSGIVDARVLAREWRGELTEVETPPGALKIRVMTPLGTGYDVSYSIATGDTMVQTTTIAFLTKLLWLHMSHGIWTVVVGLVSVAMLLLGVSGLYLWFRNHKERRAGIALLIIGVGVPLVLMISMRL